MLLIVTISTFVCITLAVMGLYWLLGRPPSPTTERLRKLGAGGRLKASPSLLTEEHPVEEIAKKIARPAIVQRPRR